MKVIRGNTANHLLNADGNTGRALNQGDEEYRIVRGACGNTVWGGGIEETNDLRVVTCKRCRATSFFRRATT